MAAKRIGYSIILIATLVAFIVTDSAVALYLFVCLLALPLVSLMFLVLASRRVKFDCAMRDSCIRGGILQLTMKMGVTPRFAVGVAQIVAEIENTTFRKTEQKSFVFKDLSFAPHTYDYNSADSGRISVRFKYIRLIDIFGLFAIRIKTGVFAESLVSPVLHDGIQVRLGANRNDMLGGEMALQQKGGDVTEIHNIRDYIPGDALGSVHWKLSSKFDTLKSKEFGSTADRRLLILVDMSKIKYGVSATDEQLNGVLDVAISVSDALKSSGYAHSVGWFNNGIFSSSEVTDNDSFVAMVSKLMSIKVCDGNEEQLLYLSRSPECLSYSKVILVAESVHTQELKDYGHFDITALTVRDGFGEVADYHFKIINVPHDKIDATLSACVL